MILGQDRTKLSKRHGATSVSAYAEAGFLADAMINYLTLLGWSAPDGRDVFDRQYAIANFALDRVNSAPAVFDPQKFEWLNGQYIHAMDAAALRPLVVTAIGIDAPWLEEAIDVVKTSVHLLPQFREAIRFVTEYTPPEVDRAFASAVADDLREHGAPHDADAVKAMNERLKKATGLKGKELFMPLRLVMTGMDHGPELVRAIPAAGASQRVGSARALAARARRAMYSLIRKLLFQLDAEDAHEFAVRQMIALQKIPIVLRAIERFCAPPASARRELLGMTFPSPIGIAAGFDKNGLLMPMLAALGFGFVEVGTVTLRPATWQSASAPLPLSRAASADQSPRLQQRRRRCRRGAPGVVAAKRPDLRQHRQESRRPARSRRR